MNAAFRESLRLALRERFMRDPAGKHVVRLIEDRLAKSPDALTDGEVSAAVELAHARAERDA